MNTDRGRSAVLEALERRLEGQPEAVRRVLQQKLDARRAACAQEDDQANEGVGRASAPPPPACPPLADLNAYLRQATLASREGCEAQQLANARRFLKSWERASTLDRIAHAAARTPANAGPLNSHALVLRSLEMMRELSPDYLRRFVSHVESLQWLVLARAPGKPAPAPARTRSAGAKKGRSRERP
jgi:hypothetical protein